MHIIYRYAWHTYYWVLPVLAWLCVCTAACGIVVMKERTREIDNVENANVPKGMATLQGDQALKIVLKVIC